MLRLKPLNREDGRHHKVRLRRRKPLMVKSPATCRLKVSRKDIAVNTRARVKVR